MYFEIKWKIGQNKHFLNLNTISSVIYFKLILSDTCWANLDAYFDANICTGKMTFSQY